MSGTTFSIGRYFRDTNRRIVELRVRKEPKEVVAVLGERFREDGGGVVHLSDRGEPVNRIVRS